MAQNKILITGVAGFIGFHLCRYFSKNGFLVTGIDSVNDYYDVRLKNDRLFQLGTLPDGTNVSENSNFKFHNLNICDKRALNELFKRDKFSHVIHLAAQAGVRNSIQYPQSYLDNNIQVFFNLLESCRMYPPRPDNSTALYNLPDGSNLQGINTVNS